MYLINLLLNRVKFKSRNEHEKPTKNTIQNFEFFQRRHELSGYRVTPSKPTVKRLAVSKVERSDRRFCDYPQEIILELSAATRIQHIQILSHQCKISSKVEIHAYLPKDHTLKAGVEYALNPSEIKFTKVGHFLFGSNEAVKFQSREFRTVNLVDVNALYVKFVYHKCHINKLNIFNQIGIIAISVLGEPLSVPLGGPGGIPDHGFQQLEYNMQFDEETLGRLRMLEKARDRAEKEENYSEAKKLNEAISDLKRIGVNLQKLEERKAIAVRNKDYDSAMILKKVEVYDRGNRFVEESKVP